MSGIICNVLCVVIGGLIGSLFGKFLSKRLIETTNSVFGICSIGMGIYSIILMKNMPPVILAMILGTIIGNICNLTRLFTAGGKLMQKAVSKVFPSGGKVSGEEYESLLVTTMVLFCCSSTGIYGCLDAGMTGDCSILFSKSILDFFTALIFACSLGFVTSVIAIPQTVIFVCLFFIAKFVVSLTTPTMINDFRACGGFILIATGFRVSKIKEFAIADMIPALILVMPLSWLWTQFVVPLL